MKRYEYCVHVKNRLSDFIFVFAADYQHAINRAYKEWFEQNNCYRINKEDLRARRVTK